MDEGSESGWSIDRVRAVTVRLGAAVAAHDPDVSQQLSAAAGFAGSDAEALLVLRSALISTRAIWTGLDTTELVTEGRSAIAAGKRLSIRLGD